MTSIENIKYKRSYTSHSIGLRARVVALWQDGQSQRSIAKRYVYRLQPLNPSRKSLKKLETSKINLDEDANERLRRVKIDL